MLRSALLFSAVASLATAHFTVNWPLAAGGPDEESGYTSPCGDSEVVVTNSSTAIQVDRFTTQIFSSHPAGSWSFRVTTDTKPPYHFTDAGPAVDTTGVGDFCLTQFRAPKDFAGKEGVLQIVNKSPDGALYQCAPVRFVTGANNTLGSSCKNNTGFAAKWDSTGTTANTNATSTNSSSSSSSSTVSSGSSSSTSTGTAAMVTAMGSMLGLSLMVAAALVL